MRICSDSAKGIRAGQVVGLGAILGILAITRPEYALLLPITTALFLGLGRFGGWSASRVWTGLLMLWMSAMPLLMLEPMISGWHGPTSFAPPDQSRYRDIWRTWYDLELTQLRYHRLDELAHLASRVPDAALPRVSEQVRALKYSAAGEDPVDDQLLDRIDQDIRTIRGITASRGLSVYEAYRVLGLQLVAAHPWGYAKRVLTRLGWYASGADSDWPSRHPARWLYTAVLRPLSTLGYAFLIILLAGHREGNRWLMMILGAWVLFPIAVHSVFTFEQRFLYPSIPLLCVLWGRTIDALGAWRASRRVGQPWYAASPTF